MAAASSAPAWIAKQVAELKRNGAAVDTISIGGQCYVVVRGIPAPAPPWDRSAYDILVAVPLADGAALDGFYLRLPYKYDGVAHPRVNGQPVTFESDPWQLVSWHYAEGHPWKFPTDSLETHLAHCQGFFLHRGAINAK
jgi:hypothetical protein